MTGTVTDGFGNSIASAMVTVTQDGTDFAAITDANGSYRVATESGNPLATGTYPMTCGNVTQNVFIGSGTTFVDFSGVDPVSTAQRTFDVGLLVA